MSKRVLLHVGTPKTGTSYLQDVLFRNRRAAPAEHGILYPADRFDAHFLAALDLMRLPWGGLEIEAIGAWDRLAAGGPQLGRHLDHQPRDPGHRLARPGRPGPGVARPRRTAPRSTWCSRCATWSARSRPSGRRTSSTARPDLRPRSSTSIRDPAPRGPDRHLVLGRPGGPRHPRPLGPRPATGAVHLVTVPRAGEAARPAVEAVRDRVRARRHRPRPRRRAGQPVARRRPRRR